MAFIDLTLTVEETSKLKAVWAYMAQLKPGILKIKFILLRYALDTATLLAGLFLKLPEVKATDFLFIHVYENEIQKTAAIVGRLKEAGFTVEQIVFDRKKIIQHRELVPSWKDLGAGIIFLFERWYTRFVCVKYRPKVIVTLEDCLYLSPYLKRAMTQAGGKYVNIAHAVIPQGPWHFMTDFHCFFVFGESSIENLRHCQNKYGETDRFVISGSPFLARATKETVLIKENRSKMKVLYMGTWFLPADEKESAIQSAVMDRTYEWLSKMDAEVYYKPHPVAKKDEAFETRCRNSFNLCTGDQLVGDLIDRIQPDLLVHHYSNSALEAGAKKLPAVSIYMSNYDDNSYLQMGLFKLPCLTEKNSLADFQEIIGKIQENPEEFRKRQHDFYKFHVGQDDGVSVIVKELVEIVKSLLKN